MSRHFHLMSELSGAIYPYHYCIYKRASLACAARLADTLCPPEAPFGRLEVTLVNYKGDIISKYVHLRFKIDFTRKRPKLSIFKILMRNDDVITE